MFEIEANRSGSFTYRDADELFDLLMAESINRIGGMMVFDLVTFAQEYMPGVCVGVCVCVCACVSVCVCAGEQCATYPQIWSSVRKRKL